MQSVRIRQEVESDHPRVREIHEAAFGQPEEADLVVALRSSAAPYSSLVAEIERRIVGHVLLSPVSIEGKSPEVGCAGLAPLGVHPSVQRRGVGSALVREALRGCPALGWSAVFLLGDPSYYSRFGFVLAAPLGFHYESERFDSSFQVIELEPEILSAYSGWVRYHEAFSGL